MAIGPVVYLAFGDCVSFLSVSVMVHDRADGSVYRQLLPIYAETRQLGVEIGEVAAL